MMIQRSQTIFPSVIGRRTVCRSATCLMLLALVIMGLPALAGAQQTCRPDGDVDQNGGVTAADALLVFQQALSLVDLSACQQIIADVYPQPTTPDGTITASDALCIFQKALSLPSCLDILPPDNQLPVAEAGPDQSADAGKMVTLSGAASRDPDGTIASYAWKQTGGTIVSLSGADSDTAMFTAPDVSADETLTFSLTVTDSDGAEAIDEVAVMVRRVNKPPIADAGPDQTADAGTVVILSGTASDPDGHIASHVWEHTGGMAVLLTGTDSDTAADADSATAMFTAPDVSADETLTFRLTVTDNDGAEASDEVTVMVRRVNKPPIADAGPDQSVDAGMMVILSGTANDPDGPIASHVWEQTGGTTVSLTGADSDTAVFTAPDVAADETLTFQLTVTDNDGAQASDEVSVTARPVNQPPVVIVEEAFPPVAEAGVIVFLIGTASDPDGTMVSYRWEQTAGAMVLLASADELVTAFTAPDVSTDETLAFRLTVTDNNGATGHDTVSVTVTPPLRSGRISGALIIGEGSVLDGDTKDEFDPAVENSTLQGQRIPLTLPVTVAGHVNHLDDEVDVYHFTLPVQTDIVLKTGDWPDADLDLYLAETSGSIVDASIGYEQFEVIGTGLHLEGEFLVMVQASAGASNYVLSLRTHDNRTFSEAYGSGTQLGAEFEPDNIIVEFREGLDDARRNTLLTSVAGDVSRGIAGLVQLEEEVVPPSGPILLEFQDTFARLALLHGDTGVSRVGPLHYATPEAAEKARMLQTIKTLGFDPDVSYAEPNLILRAFQKGQRHPDDPEYVAGRQSHYQQINLPRAWNLTTGSDDIVVAVIDTGVAFHNDLDVRLLRPGPRTRVVGYDFVRDSGKANDGDGIDPNPADPLGEGSDFHGTHVAGTIGAWTNNGRGLPESLGGEISCPCECWIPLVTGRILLPLRQSCTQRGCRTVPVQFHFVVPTS